jgi:peptidoglycan hydrolase-like protein with peptidoglycan-binding domain
MADIIMHESVLSIATEGSLFGDGQYDVRYPHWPAYSSGVTIGLGFDIGASKISAENLHVMLSSVGVPDGMINELAKTVYITGVAANQKLIELNLRDKVKITQQQAIDIMMLVNQNYTSIVRKSFSASYGIMHPSIIVALNKIAYGAPAMIAGWAQEKYAGLGPLFDSKMAAISDHIKQCDFFIEMMDYMRNFPWKDAGAKEVHGKRVTKAMSSFILKIQDHLKKGDKVVIDKGPVNVDDLLSPGNKTFDFSIDISNSLSGTNLKADYLIKNMQTARNKEPEEMKKLCSKFNYPLPPLSGTIMTESIMANFYSMMNSAVDINLKKAQGILVNSGYYAKAGISGGMANADGIYGSNTAAVLKLYQKEHKLKETGILDNQTKELLFKKSVDEIPDIFFEPIAKIVDNVVDFFENIPKNLGSKVESINYSVDFLKAYQGGNAKISNSVGEGAVNKGKDVAIVKGLLCKSGYYHLDLIQMTVNLFSANGLEQVNKELIQAISSYQKDKKLKVVDGRIDPDGETIQSLNGLKTVIHEQQNNTKETSKPEIKDSAKPNEQLKKIQAILIKEGLLQATFFSTITNTNIGSDDGIWGELSAKAMYRFQQKYGLKTDGKPNQETIDFIKQNYGKSKKEEDAIVVAEAVPGSGFYPCFN